MRHHHIAPLLIATLVAPVSLGACGDASGPDPAEPAVTASPAEPGTSDPSGECPDAGEEWEVAKLYIEHNATDADTGVHGFFGGAAWRELCVFDPGGYQIWFADPVGALHDLGVSDFFFESREPPADVYTLDDVRRDFPEGTYVVSGTDHDGVPRVGAATFTHDIPVPPIIVAPALTDDAENADEAIAATGPLVVAWEPVTETIDGEPVAISAYEVIVTMEEFDDPHGWSRPVFDVHVGAGVTSLTLSPEFLDADTIYELEVLALEESGNQTISVGFFRTS